MSRERERLSWSSEEKEKKRGFADAAEQDPPPEVVSARVDCVYPS